MHRAWSAGVAIAALAVLALVGAAAHDARVPVAMAKAHSTSSASHNRLLATVRRLGIRFEPNVGQTASQIKYLARANGYMVGLTEQGLVLKLDPPRARRRTLATSTPFGSLAGHRAASAPAFVYITPIHAHPDLGLQPEGKLASISNYFIGNNPKDWQTRVPNYAAVRYQDLYPGVDWTVYGNLNRLEYDLRIAPYANPRAIRFRIAGADQLSLNSQGNLVIGIGHRSLQELKPVVYQVAANGSHQKIAGHYVLDGQQVAFALGRYDHARALVIDPTLEYSTYLGGSCCDKAFAIAVDSAGDTYVTGMTSSANFPTANAIQPKNGGDNAFVSKFNANGSALVYSTFLGGNGSDIGHAIAVDAAGEAYVAGSTSSTNFPTINAFQPTNKSKGTPPEQAFVAKLNTAGDALVYSTYLGGSGESGASLDEALGIAVDGTGEAFVTGLTNSPDFPIVNAYQSTYTGRGDVFVTKFDAAGNALVYSTFLGGSAFQDGAAIAVNAMGSAYVTGITNSINFPLASPFQATNLVPVNSTQDSGFVTKFSLSGASLEYSTYLGGNCETGGAAIAVDSDGDAYVAGSTCAMNFPTVDPYQSKLRSTIGDSNAFVTKFNPTGNALEYSTYLGGSFSDVALGIAVNSAGDAWIVGGTASTDFPTVDPLQDTNKAELVTGEGDTDAFVTEFNATGSALLFSTYWGGSGSWGPAQNHTPAPFGDAAYGVTLDGEGNVYVAGTTGSGDFPVCVPFQAKNNTATEYGTSYNAFVTKFSVSAAGPSPCSSSPLPDTASTGSSSGGGGGLSWAVILTLAPMLLLRKYKTKNREL